MKQNLWNILINGLNKDLVVNKITANTEIDATKVLQKQDETFIHRSFYAKNFKATKTVNNEIK